MEKKSMSNDSMKKLKKETITHLKNIDVIGIDDLI